MQIKKVRGKNFFSIGNSFTEIDIEKYKKSVLVGSNGAGKSGITNLIAFALFGKPIKKITKGLIVNSINGKNCLVEIEFSANGNEYLIRRGIKPNIFEIHENGSLVDQSSVSDYQDYLEQNILKCSHRTFLQTSIISIENYTPFMSLAASSRREFVEDILDIKVFSVMNQLVKSKITKNKDQLKLLDVHMKSIKDKLLLQKAHVEHLEQLSKTGTDVIDTKLASLTDELSATILSIADKDSLQLEYSTERTKLRELQREKNSLNNLVSSLNTQISVATKDVKFFENNTTCPTCRQELADDHVHEIVSNYTSVGLEYQTTLSNINAELVPYANLDDLTSTLTDKEYRLTSRVSTANSAITRLNREIATLNNEKTELEKTHDITGQRESMKSLAKDAIALRDNITSINQDQSYNVVMLELFKDSGIKSKIVDQYIPIINTLVNQYLDKLEFFVLFNLDSEFNETIKSRHRDAFTYNSFSAGERMKIDLSLMFTFRQIARMKNAFDTNLLFLDEIFDASVDSQSIDLLMGILDGPEFDKTNLFVISHRGKEFYEETFDGIIEVYKRDGFTQLTYSN